MISSIYFISLIVFSVTTIYFLDKLNIKTKYKPYFEGLLFGIIAVIGINVHYNFVEPTALFPKINIFLSHSSLVALSFFLFGYKAGLITLIFLSPSRVFLTEEFLFYSLVLIFLSSINGYYFNRIYIQRNLKTPDYKIILIFILVQSFINLVLFLSGPVEVFEHNLNPILIYLIPITSFVNLLIASGIKRSRYQNNLLSELKCEKTLLSNVLYNLSEAIIIIDQHQNILRINNLAEILIGYKSSEIHDKRLSDIFLLKDKNLFETISNQIKNIGKNEIILHSDFIIISKSGEEIAIECKISCAFEKEFNQKVVIILLKDIRELKSSKRKIEESEKRFRQFFDFSSEGIWHYEIKIPVNISLPVEEQIKLFYEFGYLSDCNDTFAKMYGFNSKEELIGIPLSATLVPDDENNLNYLKNFILNNYKLSNAESIEKDKYGNIKYFTNSLYGIIENNNIIGAWGIQIDITEEKLMTKQIRDNNRLLLSILNAPKGIIIFSLDRNYCYTAFSISHKETMKKIWGNDIEIGMNMLDAIKSESDRIKAKNNFDKVLNGEHLNLLEEFGDEKHHRKHWINNYSPIYDNNEIIGIAVYVTDITLQKQFEAEVERKNLLLNTLINTIPDSIYVKDINLRKILTNKTDLKWMGYDDEKQVLGKRDDEIYGEEFAKISLEDDKKVIGGNPVINREEKITTKNNDEIIILTNKVPLLNKNGEIIGLIGIGRDITEKKKYLNELEKNQQKLNILFNQSFQFIGLLTPSGIVLEANQTACDFIGIDVKEVKNLPFPETPWWTHSKEQQDRLRQVIKSASEGNFIRMETTHLYKNKQKRIIDFSLKPIKNQNGKVVYLIAEGRDITEIRELERKLLESQEKYKILVEASMDAISIMNSEGVILFENPRHKELFNQISNIEFKRNYFNLVHKSDLEKLKLELKNIYLNETSNLISLRFIKNENDFFWGDLSLRTFVDSENQKLYMLVLRDITYKKQIEDELKKRVYELEKYNQLMVGREIKMVELKKEINSLCKEFGLPVRYSENDI